MKPASEEAVGFYSLCDQERLLLKEKRSSWEKRYEKKGGNDFDWYLPEPPEMLINLLKSGRVPDGPAVDLGCGPGVITSFLFEYGFRPAVGMDIALSAINQARQFCLKKGTQPSFAVAAAPLLPFADGRCAFLFDRGGLHALPESMWQLYLCEVARMLRPDGVFQLWAKLLPLSRLEEILPDTLQILSLEQFPFGLKSRRVLDITHGIFKRI